MIASICLCSLNWDNPAVGFFDVIEIGKKFKFTNGQDLYKYIIRFCSVIYKGVETPMFKLKEKYLSDLKKSLEQTIGAKLEYYNRVLDNCLREAGECTSYLLDVLYNKDITNQSSFMKDFSENYGYPLIDAKNYSAMPTRHNAEGPKGIYKETACFLGLELLISRLIDSSEKPVCRRWKVCSLNMYSEPEKCVASEECFKNPWDKTEVCMFTNALKYYGLDKKRFVIDE
jgi:hypothetical protein